ncbi:MAG: hypothetical protein H7343_00580 [Undibacterium sp.]|nr:hypothetical protein [Opitutaceae bacterium]
MKIRSLLALFVSAVSLLLTACGTTGSTATVASASVSATLISTTALTSAGGDVLSGSFGHEAVGASLLNLSQGEKARQARAQADYDYRSYVVWKGTQKS